MGGAVSSGRDNNELIDNLMGGNYIRTRAVERVFRALDRADYMTPERRDEAYKDLAWRNGPLHMSAPCIYSEVLEGLELRPGLSFLNIGSGTGYFSTLVGLIIGSSGINHGVEVHPYVMEYAVKKLGQFIENSPTLDEFDFCEPRFYCGNGLCVAPLQTPYDRVYCGAGCPEEYETYFKQLIKVGGILVMPLNDNLLQVRRTAADAWTSKSLLNVSFATLRVPTKEEGAELIRLEEQCPARLQVLCRSVVRHSMREALLSRNPQLREPPPRSCNASSCPRRICIPIEDDSDVEGLNALHDLDQGSGANEMNALLSLVLSMGRNRVAGALRFDSLDSVSDSADDLGDSDLNGDRDDGEGDADGNGDAGADPDPDTDDDAVDDADDYVDADAIAAALAGHHDQGDDNDDRPARPRRSERLRRAARTRRAERSPRAGSSLRVGTSLRVGPSLRIGRSFRADRAPRSGGSPRAGRSPRSERSPRPGRSPREEWSPRGDRSARAERFSRSERLSRRALSDTPQGDDNPTKPTHSCRGLITLQFQDQHRNSNCSAHQDGPSTSHDSKATSDTKAPESIKVPAEVEIYLGKEAPSTSRHMEWESEQKRNSSSDEEATETSKEQKRKKLDSGIGEGTTTSSGTSPAKSESFACDESDLEEVRSDNLSDDMDEENIEGRRRLQKRGHYALGAQSSSTEGENSGAEAEEDAVGRRRSKRRAGAAGDGPRPRRQGPDALCPRRLGPDARRVRLSILMKRGVKDLPLPYALKKYVNLGRCFEF